MFMNFYTMNSRMFGICFIFICSLFALTHNCIGQKKSIDLLIINATVYTVDSKFSKAEAIAIKDGKIIDVGKTVALQARYVADKTEDQKGKYIYPGFIDAHAHFVGYGTSLQRVNLVGTTSWQDVIDRTTEFIKANNVKPGEWILGRGWDQNDWTIKEFPNKEKLDQVFPDNPVMLTRIDGHAAITNQKALDLAGIKPGDQIVGGEYEVKNGSLTGILVDNAMDAVGLKIPAATDEQFAKSLKSAEANCFAVGLTTVDDCGLGFGSVERIKKLHEIGQLKMRMYVMLSDDEHNFQYLERTGKIKTDRLNVRSFKVYGDGALGSRGACLLQPYSDKPGHYGFLLSSKEHFDSVAQRLFNKGFQMCTHAIGDSGNRTILNIYKKYLKGKNDLRWRIEHAQVVNSNDFKMFGRYSVIPSVQPTHATSDMYWAGDRVGNARVKGAYAYQELLQQNNWLPLGTDFPVEDISPFKTFFAAVFRKDSKGWPANGYQTENALTRQQALRGMTIWAARSNFEESEKGSLEKGKFADFIVLDQDLMTIPENKILQTQVIRTYVNGEKVYEKK